MIQRRIEAIKVELGSLEAEHNQLGRMPRNLPALHDQLSYVQVCVTCLVFLWITSLAGRAEVDASGYINKT